MPTTAIESRSSPREAWQQALAIIEDLSLPGADQIRVKLQQAQPAKVTQSR
jgi:hypothetical protein